ncbi:MAG: hypothetical protein JNM27_09900 [Leptospirales bacterium]|nr:hypothetical protein [Leptospirales bacterium]
MVWIRRILYTIVFSAFFLIFSGVARDILERVNPGLMAVPEIVTGEFLLKWIGIFTIIVLISFWGAGMVVYKNAAGKDPDDPEIQMNPRRRPWRD